MSMNHMPRDAQAEFHPASRNALDNDPGHQPDDERGARVADTRHNVVGLSKDPARDGAVYNQRADSEWTMKVSAGETTIDDLGVGVGIGKSLSPGKFLLALKGLVRLRMGCCVVYLRVAVGGRHDGIGRSPDTRLHGHVGGEAEDQGHASAPKTGKLAKDQTLIRHDKTV